jgi:uncharacterized protein YecE (DUF72 family)
MQNLFLGTIGFSYDFWKGGFYPPNTNSKDYLRYYASKFTTVEVDSTFYRIPSEQTVTSWKNQTPKGFKFALKFPRSITHIKMLKDCQNETRVFLQRANLLEEKLGPMLLQFPPNFTIDHLPDLVDYLQNLPKTIRHVVEVRNKSWLKTEFYSALQTCGVALAWADSQLSLPTSEVTADFLYIRWEGDRKKVNGALGKIENDRQTDLKNWAAKLRYFLDKQMNVFGYFGKYYSGFPPSDVSYLQTELDIKVLGSRKQI